MTMAVSSFSYRHLPWTLAVVMAVVMLITGWRVWQTFIRQFDRQRDVEAKVRQLGGEANTEVDEPNWLQRLLGKERLASVVSVTLGRPAITDADLSFLQDVPNLRRLSVGGTQVRGTALAHLHGHTRLSELDLYGSQIGDAELAHLTGLK